MSDSLAGSGRPREQRLLPTLLVCHAVMIEAQRVCGPRAATHHQAHTQNGDNTCTMGEGISCVPREQK